MNVDVPSIATGTYSSTAYGIGSQGGNNFISLNSSEIPNWVGNPKNDYFMNQLGGTENRVLTRAKIANSQQNQEINKMSNRRLVKVIIVDPNENIPLNDCILYSGEEKLTDATDQELFFEIDIKRLLDEHNVKRTKFIDKKVKERSEYLEPAKIRDLKMVVVGIASF
jgi:hypothetical protein